MNGERLEMIRMLLKKIEYIRECISLPDVGGKAEPWHFKGVVSCHIARQADFSQSTIFCLFISSKKCTNFNELADNKKFTV